MILRRLVVRHFRGIREARFEGLADGLNLFYGPNESGKSTLVEAIHYGLFERSSGEARGKREIRTWNGTEAPEVEVDFEDDAGQLWRVHKRFLVQPTTTLEGRSVVLRGEDAEKRLRDMLGTRRGGNKGVDDADLGIWPLLWVRQGRSGAPVKEDTHADARAVLSDSLAQQTGEIVAGEQGERIRARARALYEEHFTATGRPNAATERVLTAAREAAARVAELRAGLDEAQRRASALSRAEADLVALEPRLADRRRAATLAKEKADQVRALVAGRDHARTELDLAETRWRGADDARKVREDLARAVEEAAGQRAEADAAEAAQAAVTAAAEQERAEAQEALERARTEEKLAVRAAETAGRAGERALLAQRRSELVSTKARVDALQAELRALQATLDAAPLGAADLERLEAAERERARQADRAEASAARVTVTSLRGGQLDGEDVPAGKRRTVVATTSLTLRLDDRWQVEVDPGAATGALAELRAAESRITELLTAFGLPDLAAARTADAARREAEAAKAVVLKQLQLVGPDGTAPLVRELARIERQLAELPEPADATTPEAAQARREQAASALLDAEVQAEAKRALRERAGEVGAGLRERARAAREEHARLQTRLDAAAPATTLADEAERTREAVVQARARLQAAERAWSEAGGAAAEAEAQREAQALAVLVDRHDKLREEVVGLRAQVRAHQDDGLYDALGTAEAEAEAARAEAEALERKAATRKALHEALEASWAALRDRFVEPVRRAIEAEVPLLFPGSRLLVDDEGDVVGLVTAGQEERFEQLSGGAREQLGVLIRLGLARVLAGDRRLPVLLDDALVNSDLERRSRMVDVLRRMSEHLQVLLFTCHDEDFDRLGPDWHQEVRGRPRRGG